MNSNKLNLWFGALLTGFIYNYNQRRGKDMDNIKTGVFIKELRKEKSMTQKELADLLHITDRAVSKWERGLCTPDISLLEPLAAALGVTVTEIISGERQKTEKYTDEIDLAVKNTITYSENEIIQKVKAVKKRMLAYMISAFLILLLLIPTLNGILGGNGFAWECIPAYYCAQNAAKAVQTYDEEAIQTYIGNSDGVFTALSGLKDQGVILREASAKFSRTRLEDMFLLVEVDFIVMYEEINYQFTCSGTYNNGQIEFMNIVNPSFGQDYPTWMLQLSDALSTYNPG